MSHDDTIPELRQIIGAMLFGAKQPIAVSDIRRVLKQVAEEQSGFARDFAKASPADIREALDSLRNDLTASRMGFNVVEVASGYRLVNDAASGVWLRRLLERGKPQRLSQPALETLAIIAYRQPCTRAEIEAVRGVEVDQMVRNLLELQLIRLVSRAELPGRPWLLGTNQKFLEHFGLKSLDDLPGVEELRRMENEQLRRQGEPDNVPEPAAADECDEDDDEDDDEE